jgi:hypothetical protein
MEKPLPQYDPTLLFYPSSPSFLSQAHLQCIFRMAPFLQINPTKNDHSYTRSFSNSTHVGLRGIKPL